MITICIKGHKIPQIYPRPDLIVSGCYIAPLYSCQKNMLTNFQRPEVSIDNQTVRSSVYHAVYGMDSLPIYS